jgi:hypothetical protein
MKILTYVVITLAALYFAVAQYGQYRAFKSVKASLINAEGSRQALVETFAQDSAICDSMWRYLHDPNNKVTPEVRLSINNLVIHLETKQRHLDSINIEIESTWTYIKNNTPFWMQMGFSRSK